MAAFPESAPPSLDVLAEAAARIGSAYPELFEHQRTGVTFLLSRRRAILADQMGLGKSRTAIIALREAAPAGPFLIVCPAGVRLTWRREIHLVEPDATVQVQRCPHPRRGGWPRSSSSTSRPRTAAG